MLDYLKGFLDAFWSKLLSFQLWIWDHFVQIISDILYWFFDLCLGFVYSMVSAISFSESYVLDAFSSWNLLPPQVIWLLNRLDLHIILLILASAYGLRLLLNLIPASLTRV